MCHEGVFEGVHKTLLAVVVTVDSTAQETPEHLQTVWLVMGMCVLKYTIKLA